MTDTWMPIYWGDYLKDTMHLDTREHGTYLLLIGYYWSTGGPLPDDDHVLKNISKNTSHFWKKIRPKIEKFFIIKDGVWRHRRIDDELRKAAENQEKRHLQAKKAAEKRWSSNDAPSMPGALPRECPSPSPSPSPKAASSQQVEIGNRCLELMGADPSRWAGDFSVVGMWMNEGADPDRHIFPTVRRVAERRNGSGPPRSLSYFTEAIREAVSSPVADREAEADAAMERIFAK